jgi:hypothetical protein
MLIVTLIASEECFQEIKSPLYLSGQLLREVFSLPFNDTWFSILLQVLRKADMIRKNAVESVRAERNILISARNPFVV